MAQGTSYAVDKSPFDRTNPAHDLQEKANVQFEKVAGQVEDAVKTLSERGRAVGEEVQAVAGNLKTAVDTSVKEQPMATLAVAAAIGFVLGALWKS